MSVEITSHTLGLSCHLVHGPSASELHTEPPKDNGGTGARFSPTDLLAASLLSCALTTLALTSGREGLAWGRAEGRVVKEMSSSPRRVGKLTVELHLPAAFPVDHRPRYEDVARRCPVALSLSPSMQVEMHCHWDLA